MHIRWRDVQWQPLPPRSMLTIELEYYEARDLASALDLCETDFCPPSLRALVGELARRIEEQLEKRTAEQVGATRPGEDS